MSGSTQFTPGFEGTLTLEHEGRPTTTSKAGEAFYVDPGKIHVGSNGTGAPLKFLATLVVEIYGCCRLPNARHV